MMNKKPSSRFHLGKYLFLLPALVFIGVGFTAALAQDKMEGLTQKTQEVVWKTGKTANHTENEQIQEEEPLFVVNGKTYDRATIDIMDPSTIEEINVLKDESAIEKYGEKGKYGVIEVALKEGEEVPVLTDGKKTQAFDRYKRGLFFIDGKESSFEEAQELKPNQIKRMSVIKQPGSVAEYGEKAKNGVVKIKLKRKGENTEPGNPRDLPLYIVNGKKKSFKEVEKLGPDQIESIDVLKDKELIAEYGEEGKNGVVIISLKKHAN